MPRILLTCFFLGIAATGAHAETSPTFIQRLIPWLLDESSAQNGISFAEVITTTTGKKVVPNDPKDPVNVRVVDAIGKALDATLAEMNTPEGAARKQTRVNEMSSHFEDALRVRINATDGLTCEVPRTAAGGLQRSGYPDLRIVDRQSGRVFYLDPKLYAKGSRSSSLRTFYFTPRRETNKVLDDAVHFIAGIEHEKTGAEVKFTRWELIDLAQFKVRLKAEFEGSNADLYRDSAVVGRSAQP